MGIYSLFTSFNLSSLCLFLTRRSMPTQTQLRWFWTESHSQSWLGLYASDRRHGRTASPCASSSMDAKLQVCVCGCTFVTRFDFFITFFFTLKKFDFTTINLPPTHTVRLPKNNNSFLGSLSCSRTIQQRWWSRGESYAATFFHFSDLRMLFFHCLTMKNVLNTKYNCLKKISFKDIEHQ